MPQTGVNETETRQLSQTAYHQRPETDEWTDCSKAGILRLPIGFSLISVLRASTFGGNAPTSSPSEAVCRLSTSMYFCT